jgi:hypothetical protein
VADEIVVESHEGFWLGVKNAEEVVNFAKRELGVAEGGHWCERGGLSISERADGFVPLEESVESGQVNMEAGRRGAGLKCEPVDDIALDGLCQIVDGVGTIGEAKVDDRRGARVGFIGPENVGGMKIVVGPQGLKCAQMRAELLVERLEQFERLASVLLRCGKYLEGFAVGNEGGQCGNRIVRGEDSEAGNQRAIEAAWR